MTRLQAASQAPSNVALFFAVDDARGEPVPDLRAHDFRIFEDGKLVSVDESKQTIVSPELAADHHTLLLVDMSASVTASDQLAAIAAATREFVTTLEPHQHVAVYAFDGSKNLYEVLPFAHSPTQTQQVLERLRAFESKDFSTNLHGALLAALAELDQSLQRGAAPLHFGSLVVFTDGTDRANRVPYQQMIDAVEASAHSVFALGVGREIDDSTLARIGKSGYIRAEDSAASHAAFREIAERIVRLTRRYYLLSYCSPARAGQHTVTIEASAQGRRGRIDYAFDASGFGPSCDPSRPPAFDGAARSLELQASPDDVTRAQRP